MRKVVPFIEKRKDEEIFMNVIMGLKYLPVFIKEDTLLVSLMITK